jgi:hypothetical protein
MGRTFNRQKDWDRPSNKLENRSEKSFDKYKKSIYNRMSMEESLDDNYDIDEEDDNEINTTPIQRK